MRLKGRTAEAILQVHSPDTAEAALLPHVTGLPAVLPISRLVALMELAAGRLMRSSLRDGESSVALEINLTHVTRKGTRGIVRAVARYRGIAGRVHHFTVHTFDESGLIASAEHTRAVVVEQPPKDVERRAGRRATQLAV